MHRYFLSTITRKNGGAMGRYLGLVTFWSIFWISRKTVQNSIGHLRILGTTHFASKLSVVYSVGIALKMRANDS